MTQLLFFLFFTKTVFAQVSTERKLEQPLEPHPIIELKNWDVFNGETSLDNALNFQNNNGWKSWTLNTKWWDEYNVKWFRRNVSIPESFRGQDVFLELKVDNKGIVYFNGEKLMNVARLQGKELLIKNAKGNEIFTIVVRGEKTGYYGQFYQADIVAYPPGYSEFYSSLKSVETLRSSF